ncbi:MAG: hypothetical protein ACTSW1_19615 [Candidatus Hodarchaeales archaeon]
MGTSERNERSPEKDEELSDVNVDNFFSIQIKPILEGVQEEIQKTSDSLQLMIRGLHSELLELKDITQRISATIDNFIEKDSRRMVESSLKEISTGLDILTNVPQHLRRTFEIIYPLREENGLTAKEVAEKTGKSRPLESDYLNQLADTGFVTKKKVGKKVLFYHQPSDQDDLEEDYTDTRDNQSANIIADVRNGLKEAANSTRSDKILINKNEAGYK